MQSAVTTLLDQVIFPGLTAWDALEDARTLQLQVEEKDRTVAFSVPHSRRNFGQPQANPHCFQVKVIIHIFATSIVHNKLGVISRC